VGDVAVGFLGAGFAEFSAFTHKNHRRSPVNAPDSLGAAAALAGLPYSLGCGGVVGWGHVCLMHYVKHFSS